MGKNYYQEYKSKLVTADEAVRVVKSGDWVAYSHFVMSPHVLDKALAKRKDELRDVFIRTSFTLEEPEVFKVTPKDKHFICNSSFFSPVMRNGNVHFMPELYGDGPKLIRDGHSTTPRVFFLMTPPMDEHGYFNFSVSNSYQRSLCDKAEVIVVEVNESAPVCLGGEQESVHISEITYVVEAGERPLPSIPGGEPTDADKKISSYIIEEIEDRCTLQLGIGALTNYIGKMIAKTGLKDLSVHTEMMNDAFVDLHEKGVVTGKYKNIHKGKITYAFAMGSKKLYDFLDRNPACASFPIDIVNSPPVIMLNDKQIAVNNALMIDLFGQVASEAVDFKQISGTGGQAEFTYGASLSKGGKSFICIPSTRKLKNGKTVSRIVPYLSSGTFVTCPRTFPMFIVTEYGKVNIMGKSLWQRAEQLISIAHPDFRDELIKVAQEQNIWRRTNKIL